MKIFIYKIPDNLLYLTYKDKLEHEDKGFINSYKLEFYMNRIFANSSADYITEDIDSADFYYIPQYYSVIWQALRAKSVPVAYLDDII
jgi:hypothetical protein